MNSAGGQDPVSAGTPPESSRAFRGQPDGLWTALVVVLGLLAVPATASAAPSAPVPGTPWWGLLLSVAAGAGAMGLWHWFRLRRVQERSEARLDALRAEKREVEEALEAARDRTEKLEEMSVAKSRFLEEMSHAFRRPLTLTLGPIDTLLGGQYGALSEQVQTQLRLAQRNGTRVLWLVNQLLDLSELETGSMTLAPAEGNLVTFLTQGLRSFEDLAERRNVHLNFESALSEPTVWFDEGKMETMLANLLSSAFQAAEDGGAVRVVVRPAQDEADDAGDVELLVEYTGSEIPPGPDAEPLRWAQEEGHRDPDTVSASVGLHLVDKLADLHGGRLRRIDTTGTDEIQLAVRLPRRPDGGEHDERPHTAARTGGDAIPRFLDGQTERGALELSRRVLSSRQPPASAERRDEPGLSAGQTNDGRLRSTEALPGGNGGANGTADAAPEGDVDEDRTTILVIDDNSVICTLLRAHLEPEYRVEEAHDGAEGYNLARTILPDLVITDVMMPEVDGFELCRKIKEDPDIDHVPVVFLTARADLEGKVEGFDTGADAYLTKPFEPEALIARVESLISTRQALRESFRAEGQAENGEVSDIGGNGLKQAERALPPTAEDRSLKTDIEDAIAEHLTDPEFGVSDLAETIALSASQLRRRMKKLYDRTPVQLIRRRRLEAGARLLRERDDATIGEVAYAVGFNSQSYFSRSFRKEFGRSPSQYRSEGVAA